MQRLKVHKLKNIQLKKEIVCLYIKLTTPHLYNYFLNHLKNHKTSSEYNILDKQGPRSNLNVHKNNNFSYLYI